jgi:CheY-like chemotaxis protein
MPNPNEVEILLVEDNPRDAELMKHAMKERNLANHMVWVKDGAAALELIFGPGEDRGGATPIILRPRLILLDLKLPKIDGLEVLRQLKAHPVAKTIPVAVLTSSREESDLVRSYELGVNSYIVKPVDFDNFSEAVASLGLYWLLLNQVPENSPSLGASPAR